MTSRTFEFCLDRPIAAKPDEEPEQPIPRPGVGKRTLVEVTPAYRASQRGPIVSRAMVGPAAGRPRDAGRASPAAAAADALLPVLRGLTGSGSALPEPVAARMTRLFGHHLLHVRIHTDGEAAAAAQRLGARAFTLGDDVYFGAGEYAPGTSRGDRLLVHELTHVVQFDRGQLASAGPMRLSQPDDATEREASAMESRSEEAAALAPDAQPPDAQSSMLRLPPQPYRSGAALVQRAIGFEIQTHFAVRLDGVDWLPYKEPVFDDQYPGGKYFEMVVDHAPVPQRTGADDQLHNRDSAVLEIVLPHVERRATQQLLAERADVMRRALATATANGTAETTIENVVTQFEALLAGDGFEKDTTGRAAGIRMPHAIVGQRGEPKSASTVLPQFTIGIPLASVPIVLAFALEQGMFVDKKFAGIADFMTQELTSLQQWAPLDTAGLILIVETYLHCGKVAPEVLDYAKEIAPWMARTDFHSMYLTLSENGKRAWAAYVEQTAEARGDSDTFRMGFLSSGGASHGPKVRDWLASIAQPDKFPLDASDNERLLGLFYLYLEDDLKDIASQDGRSIRDSLIASHASPEVLTLEEAVRTPDGPRAMPDPVHVKALFTALGRGAAGDEICAAVAGVAAKLQSSDLMSRGAVRRSASSMGSMKVRDKGLEQDMAILENRMMPPWETPPVKLAPAQEGEQEEDDAGATWVTHVMASFDFLKNALAQAAQIRRSLESKQDGEEDRDRDSNDNQSDRDSNDNQSDSEEDSPDAERDSDGNGTRRKRRRSGGSSGAQNGPGQGSAPSSSQDAAKKRNLATRGRVHRDQDDHPTRVIYTGKTFTVARVDQNGDCLYRCCADFLNDGRDVAALRQLLSQSARLLPDERQAVLQAGAYGGDREIAALAHALGITIIVHEGTYQDLTVAPAAPVGDGTNGTMHLLHIYNPAEEQGHFDRLL